MAAHTLAVPHHPSRTFRAAAERADGKYWIIPRGKLSKYIPIPNQWITFNQLRSKHITANRNDVTISDIND